MSLYQFLEELNLLSTHKYSFRSNNSCINQLLFIDHTLYKAFQVFFWICSKLLITFGVKGYFIEGLFYFNKQKNLSYKRKASYNREEWQKKCFWNLLISNIAAFSFITFIMIFGFQFLLGALFFTFEQNPSIFSLMYLMIILFEVLKQL